MELNVSPSLQGFYFIREALLLLNENKFMSLHNELYPVIAAKFNTTSSRVERAIRHAVSTAQLCSEHSDLYFKLFKVVSKTTSLPTNSHVLYTLLLLVNNELEVE